MKSLERLGRLITRLWPLWLPLLLILAWPVARAIVREQVFGSPLARTDLISLGEIWGELIWGSYQEIANPLSDALTLPEDLNLQVWQASWKRSRNETPNRAATKKLVARFPDAIVVYALAIRELTPKTQAANATKPADIARLKALAQKATQLEPENAYWWVQAANAQELSGRPQAALQLLERAARCRFYDDKTREIARRSLAAFAGRRALTWEEKRAVVQLSQLYDSAQNARLWGNRARYLAKNGDARGALRWSGALAGVGDVMGGAATSVLTFGVGRAWQRQAWRVGATPGATRRQQNAAGASEKFALYAARNGRADLAKNTRAQAARARQTEALLQANRSRSDDYWLGTDDLGAALGAAQIGGVLLMCAATYLAVWWMAANVFGWRAVGAPSPRRTRVAFSGGVMGALLALATLAGWWFWRESLRSFATPRLPQNQALEVIYGTLGAFAFISAPWLLALTIAGATLWRERAQFTLAPRVDLELQLSRWARRLLRWALPCFVIGSALTLFVGWALAMIALWFNWRSVDLLAWLPPDRNGKAGSLFWNISDDPWIFIYGVLLCVVCLVGWFVKWRWGTPQRLRPLTHRALRLWKESLGCAVSWLMWVYLLLILLSLPTRTRAEARLDAVLQRGEIAVMRDLSVS